MITQLKKAAIGNIVLGNGKIAIQTMLKKQLKSYSVQLLNKFYNMGCDIIRFSIFNETEDEIREFVNKSSRFFPIISDIQGNVLQAITSLRAGCAGIRINPANFSIYDLEKIIEIAKEKKSVIRIGINTGSLSDPCETVILNYFDKYINFFESRGFYNLVLSIKSSDFDETLAFNRVVSDKFLYPMHVGLTESGDVRISGVRTTLALRQLLENSRIDTIRYSISGDEESEIRCAYEFLRTVKKRSDNFQMIACPMCARAGNDTQAFSQFVENFIFENFDIRNLKIKIAVIGCPVNGIKEAEKADIAICFTKGEYFIYNKGKCKIKTQENSKFRDYFLSEIKSIIKEN